jgi:hypothetical protein
LGITSQVSFFVDLEALADLVELARYCVLSRGALLLRVNRPDGITCARMNRRNRAQRNGQTWNIIIAWLRADDTVTTARVPVPNWPRLLHLVEVPLLTTAYRYIPLLILTMLTSLLLETFGDARLAVLPVTWVGHHFWVSLTLRRP